MTEDDLTSADVKAARNQSIFREINENLENLNRDFSEVVPVGDFVCECADLACTARIGLTIEEYEHVRSVGTHFAVRDGHVYPDVERVVQQCVGYVVVEKLGVAAEYVATNDPRLR